MIVDGDRRYSGLRRRYDLVSERLRENFWNALSDLFGLGVLGLLALLIGKLRWWTIAVAPALYCAISLVKNRKDFAAAFSSSRTNPEDRRDSILIRTHFFILAVVISGVAIATRGSIYACFAASLLWLVTVYLVKLQMEAANATKRFAYYLAKGSIEFLLILTTTLAAYCVYAWLVSRLPLNTVTLHQLLDWEESIESVHEHVEKWNPSKLWTMLLIGALYAARVLAIRYGHGRQAVSRLWALSQFAVQWMNRLALGAVIAASLTFLATRSEGPPAPLRAQIKKMGEDYSEFRSLAAETLTIKAKRQIVQQAWDQLPQPLRDVLRRAEWIQEEKIKLLDEMHWADDRYKLTGTASAETERDYAALLDGPLEAANRAAARAANEDHGADSATADDLREAVAQMSSARSEVAKEPEPKKDEMGEEFAKGVQAFVVDSERLTDTVGLLKTLTGRYPLLSEFLDVVNDAFNDYFYDHIQPRLDAFTRGVLGDRKQPVLTEIKRVAGELAHGAQLHWRINDPAWRSELEGKLRAEQTGAEKARRQLQDDAIFAKKREVHRLVTEIRQHEAEYERVAEVVPGHKDLLEQKGQMEAEVEELIQRASDGDPLSGFANAAKDAAAERAALQQFMKSWEHPADSAAALHAFNEQLRALAKARPSTAFDQLVELDRRGASQIQEIVGDAHDSVRERLRNALGKEVLDKYEHEYEAERALLTTGGVRVPGGEIPGIERVGERPIEARPEPRPEPRPMEIP